MYWNLPFLKKLMDSKWSLYWVFGLSNQVIAKWGFIVVRWIKIVKLNLSNILFIFRVSYEHREQLAKNAKTIFNKTKAQLGSMYSKFVRPLHKDKRLPVSQRLSVEKAVS